MSERHFYENSAKRDDADVVAIETIKQIKYDISLEDQRRAKLHSELNFSFTFLYSPSIQSQHVVFIYNAGYTPPSLWFSVVHTWNIFGGVKLTGQKHIPLAAHSSYIHSAVIITVAQLQI